MAAAKGGRPCILLRAERPGGPLCGCQSDPRWVTCLAYALAARAVSPGMLPAQRSRLTVPAPPAALRSRAVVSLSRHAFAAASPPTHINALICINPSLP